MARRKRKPPIVLVYGEDKNDTTAIAELIVALCPALEGRIKAKTTPTVLIRDAKPTDVPTRVQRVAADVRAESVTRDVVCVFAHEDCDDFSPSHVSITKKIEDAFARADLGVHAVTPSWELEAWFFLWPSALTAHRSSWSLPARYVNRDTGKIKDAKEELRRALRPQGRGSGRDYRESDSRHIAAKVRELGIVNQLAGKNDSFRLFAGRVAECCDAVSGR